MNLAMTLDSHRGDTLRPELELILCCARTRLDEAVAGRIRSLLRGGLNWSEVVAIAFRHHVAKLLHENLSHAAEELVPTVWQDSLRQYTRESSGQSLLLLTELVRIHEIFQAEQLPLIPYKGPVLSWLAYGNLTGRTFVDLDFVIKQANISRASSLLKSAGFGAEFAPQEELAGRAGRAPGQYGFFRKANRAQVELHTEQTLRYFPVPLDFDKLSRRFITVEIAGKKMRTFSVEDTLVMLCVHGTKHLWDRLAWIVDVAELIAAQPVDWTLAMQVAAEAKSTRVLSLGLYLAHDFLGAPLPQSVIEGIQRDLAVRWLAGKVRCQFEGGADASPGVIPRGVFRVRSRDGIWQGIRHLLRLTVSPTEHDRQIVRLPGALGALYLLIRPWRLLRDYGLGFVRRSNLDPPVDEPTPQEIVDEMLRLAGVGPGDVLFDLGCGDGRIVVSAAEKYGIRGVGVDTSPRRIAEALANARKQGVQSQVRFLQEDAKNVEISTATVVMIDLGAEAMLGLVERLRSTLAPGTRIVSRNSRIYGLPPEQIEKHVLPNGLESSIYLWRVKELLSKGSAEQSAANPAEPSKPAGS
jgi:hypothetical protein